MIVEGQLHGGVVQGHRPGPLRRALDYDDRRQPAHVDPSLLDYLVPAAS